MTLNRLILQRLVSSITMVVAVSATALASPTYKPIRVEGKDIVALVSLDGSKAVWASNLDGEMDVYVSDPDGTKSRNLTANCNSWDSSPDWSPDGKRIAFVSTRTGKPQVYVMDIDGKNLKQLTHDEHGARLPKIGPHGKIAYRAPHKDAKHPHFRRSDLVVIEGKGRQVLLNDTQLIDFAWSPDGRRIACGAESKLVLVNVADGKSREVAVTDIDGDLYNHGVFVAGWRPDSKQVACLIRYLGPRFLEETVFPGEDKFFLVAENGEARAAPLDKTKDKEFAWVAINPKIPVQPGKPPIDPRAEKKRVVAFLMEKGFPLREVESRGNVIEYAFLVGPDFKHAIGINVLLNAAEQREFAHGSVLRIAIPAHVKHDIVLWYWDMQASTNGDPKFQELFNRLKKALEDYPGPKR